MVAIFLSAGADTRITSNVSFATAGAASAGSRGSRDRDRAAAENAHFGFQLVSPGRQLREPSTCSILPRGLQCQP